MDTHRSPLQEDLVAMLDATRQAERDIFDQVGSEARLLPGSVGTWSVKDLRDHLGAWRAIEARRLEARADSSFAAGLDDPAVNDPIDEANAMLHERHAAWSWDAVAQEAEASIDALIAAIERSSTDVLCECDEGSVAGIGANGVNHAIGHLPEVADLAGQRARFNAYADEIEHVLGNGHLPPRDSGVLLYNIACARALSGDLDDARRLLRTAFGRRHDLVDVARNDADLAALKDELAALA